MRKEESLKDLFVKMKVLFDGFTKEIKNLKNDEQGN